MGKSKKRFRPTLTAYRELEEKVVELQKEKEALEYVNVFLEGENKFLSSLIEEAGETIQAMDKEIFVLCHRNLWQRIFNK